VQQEYRLIDYSTACVQSGKYHGKRSRGAEDATERINIHA
jgi:hypothetical protein